MKLAGFQKRLIEADRHVAEGADRITKQEAVVAKGDTSGRDTTEARKVLAALRKAQALHFEARDRAVADLRRELTSKEDVG
jgi:hypothetical protein